MAAGMSLRVHLRLSSTEHAATPTVAMAVIGAFHVPVKEADLHLLPHTGRGHVAAPICTHPKHFPIHTCCPYVQVPDAVGVTTQAAVQVAQAAQAVSQQAASLHAAAEVHAAKAHAATSQVQSLQATAQVCAVGGLCGCGPVCRALTVAHQS